MGAETGGAVAAEADPRVRARQALHQPFLSLRPELCGTQFVL